MPFRPPALLVFTRTTGWRHASIPKALASLRTLGRRDGFSVVATEDPALFRADFLAGFDAIAFVNTTGNVLDAAGRKAMRAFVENGGGFAGVHSACDTGYDWPWYGNLAGARFMSHPRTRQNAIVRIEDRRHPSMRGLPASWRRFDEWYDFKANPRPNVRVLATLDESTYREGRMGADHPIVWCHENLGGRSWYTGLGHTARCYSDPRFRAHLLGGLRWVMRRA